MRYELTKDLETGNATIDREHRELLRAVNQLMEACSKGQGRSAMEPAIKYLLNYVNQHFAHEEQLQQRSKYPGIAAHRAFHENYKSKLRDIISQIPAAGPTMIELGKLNTHIGILISHIRTEDKKLGAFLK